MGLGKVVVLMLTCILNFIPRVILCESTKMYPKAVSYPKAR